MHKHREITLQRIQNLSDKVVRRWLYPARHPVTLRVYHAPDRIPYAEAVRGVYEPTRVGERFGPAWSTHWFHLTAAVPAEWPGQEVHLLWDSGSEACVWQDGRPRQGLSGSGGWHRRPIRPAYRLTHTASAGQAVDLYIEMACNGLFGQEDNLDFCLNQAEIALFDREAWELLWDLVVVADMARHLPENSPRAGQALYAANQMANILASGGRERWAEARAVASDYLAARNGAGQHNLSAIGHAHLDTGWLWPVAETRRKAIRTFSSALRLMEDYPEYRFACPQAQQWQWVKESAPGLFDEMRERVRQGRFIPVGGTWVEPDCNLPSGESLVRQFLYGQGFFRREFGFTCGEFWNPDVFGYSAALPQIIKGGGASYFLTQKLSWNQFNKPANHTFLWEGLDGTRILTHFPPADTYNSLANVKELCFNVSNFKEHDRARESYLLFGYGDGGGGPTPEMLEQLRRVVDVDGLPRTEIRSPAEFFGRCAADIKDPAVWVGELYFELHRGTYTTQAANKRDNRRSELLLREVELLAALAHGLGRAAYPQAELEHLWKVVLLNQFHDILPGSSIGEVYADSGVDYAHVLSRGHQMRQHLAEALLGPATGRHWAAINSLTRGRTEVVEIEAGDLETPQRAADGQALALVTAPGLGWGAVTLDTRPETPVRLRQTETGFVMENARLKAVLGRDGGLESLVDKSAGREAIAPGGHANQFVLFDDRPIFWDAWDVDIYHLETRQAAGPAVTARALEFGPLRAAVEFTFALGDQSQIRQVVSLMAGSPFLEFACQVDWQETEKFLKVEFPLNVRASQATYEIQFGHVERPTHFNTSWDLARFEVCGHRWMDLSEPGFGVALLNDSKYGHSAHENIIRLSLLRSPTSPDPRADRGQHRFRYALLPHANPLWQDDIVEYGYRFNVPLMVRATSEEIEPVSLFQVGRNAVKIDTVKKAEGSDALVVRLYETYGSRGPVRLTSSLPIRSATRCNLLEDDLESLAWEQGGVDLDLRPFEIVTLKLTL